MLSPRIDESFEINQDALEIHLPVPGPVRLEITGGAFKKFLGAFQIPFLKMNEEGGELNQALIKISFRAMRFAPKPFQNFVGLEKFFLPEKMEVLEIAFIVHRMQGQVLNPSLHFEMIPE